MSKLTGKDDGYCKSKGKVDKDCNVRPKHRRRPVCMGHGSIKMLPAHRICNVCGGSGKIYDSMGPMGSFSPCENCKGSGLAPLPRLIEIVRFGP